MPSFSEDTPVDNDRFFERERHFMQESSPEPETHRRAEADFAGFGGQFPERRPSYPHQIEIEVSARQDPFEQPCSSLEAEGFLSSPPRTADRSPLGSPPSTPTLNQRQNTHLVHQSDVGRITRRLRRRPRSFGSHTRHSEDDSQDLSDSPAEDANADQEDEDRGGSTTPTPYCPSNYTPSQHSVETEEDHDQGWAPASPNPYSSYYTHNPERVRAEIEGFEERFYGE